MSPANLQDIDKVSFENALARRLSEKVNQHRMKVGFMTDDELKKQFNKVNVPKKMSKLLANLYSDGKMTVLEYALIEDVLNDYGIRFSEEKTEKIIP